MLFYLRYYFFQLDIIIVSNTNISIISFLSKVIYNVDQQ
nr:MAG TPA: hypothetical protein [Caudoviricetes sp.]